jgi:hypothetical protein
MDKETLEAILTMLALTVATVMAIWMIHLLMYLPGIP